jgi:phosphatidylserine decarboxylase
MMTVREVFQKIGANEDLNFLLTNRIPRLALTRFMGWFSQIRQPWVRDASIAVWRSLSELDLSEARKTHFDSLHDCFIRELKPGARTVNESPDVLTSPCDGIIGAMGRVQDGQVFQAKGFPYSLKDLLGEQASAGHWHNGWFMTIRITSYMYHRFHAPYQGRLKRVQYFSGDTWNVNPVALKRVEKLFCKNERALLETEIGPNAYPVALVPVAAVLVASIRLHALDGLLRDVCHGPLDVPCDAGFDKGEELGWFQHGSTILIFVPESFSFAEGMHEGRVLKMGEALMRLPADHSAA